MGSPSLDRNRNQQRVSAVNRDETCKWSLKDYAPENTFGLKLGTRTTIGRSSSRRNNCNDGSSILLDDATLSKRHAEIGMCYLICDDCHLLG